MKSKIVAGIVLAAIAAFACGAMLFGCSQGAGSGQASSTGGSTASGASSAGAGAEARADGLYASGTHHAKLTVEGYDPITIALDADAAPISVSNFCALASESYYDGLTFYRFADKFCMQGGTKGNNASGEDASLTPIAGEFSGNGYDNPLADDFKRGTVAMARTTNPDSATSTFFVTLDTSDAVSMSLNGQYAAFGTIDDAGMDIVDKIVADHLANVDDPAMGTIDDESKQAKIASLEIID